MTIQVRAQANGRAEIQIYDMIGKRFFEDEPIVDAKKIADELAEMGEVSDIDVRINSPGGNVFEGLAIHNLLAQHSAQVHVHVDGIAASITSVIAMAGDIVSMPENALMMIHDPQWLAMGDSTAMRKTAEVLDKIRDSIVTTYVAKTGLDEATLREMMTAETWMTGAEAVEQGFADEVTQPAEPENFAGVDNSFNFQNAPDWLQTQPDGAAAAARDSGSGQGHLFTPPPTDRNIQRGATAMSNEHQQTPVGNPAGNPPADPPANAADVRQQALAEETARRQEIRDAFNGFTNDHRELMDQCLDDTECSADQARQKLLAALGSRSEPSDNTQEIRVGADASDKFREGAVQAIMARAGVADREPQNEYNGCGLIDLARCSIEQAGIRPNGRGKDAIINAAVGHSTSDFPVILEDAMHKVLRTSFGNFPSTWQDWCDRGDLTDFRPHNRYLMGSLSDLKSLNENGEIKHTTLSDAEKEAITADENGLIITVSHKMLRNDDMGAFTNLGRLYGRAGARTIENSAYNLLQLGKTASKSGPTMNDGIALFKAGHNNLAGSGSAISVTSLGAGRDAMRKQKDPSGEDFIDLRPRFLLVPVGQEDLARKIVASETDPSQANSGVINPIRNQFEVLSSPRLTGSDWYLIADPNDAPLMEVGFLDGVSEPQVETLDAFESRGVKLRATLDFGVAAIEYRAGWRNPGA